MMIYCASASSMAIRINSNSRSPCSVQFQKKHACAATTASATTNSGSNSYPLLCCLQQNKQIDTCRMLGRRIRAAAFWKTQRNMTTKEPPAASATKSKRPCRTEIFVVPSRRFAPRFPPDAIKLPPQRTAQQQQTHRQYPQRHHLLLSWITRATPRDEEFRNTSGRNNNNNNTRRVFRNSETVMLQ